MAPEDRRPVAEDGEAASHDGGKGHEEHEEEVLQLNSLLIYMLTNNLCIPKVIS